MSLFEELNKERELMNQRDEEAFELSQQFALAEVEYQIAKRTRVLEMRDEKIPATVIQLIIKGDPAVSPKLLERTCAEELLRSTRDSMQTHKYNAGLIADQIKREWYQSGMRD